MFKIGTVQYTPTTEKLHNNLNVPVLEGITINGDLRIIYSPFDLEAGWLGLAPPLAQCYMPESAMRLGVNIVAYAMMH